MANAVEDSVGEGGIADDLVPSVNGKLAGDQRGTGAVSVFDDLHQVTPLARSKAIRPPVINDQHVRFGQISKQPRVAAIPVGEFQFTEQPGCALVDDGGVVATSLLAQDAGQPCLAHAAPLP